MAERVCATCRHWRPLESQPDIVRRGIDAPMGECHIRAPVLHRQDSFYGYFPCIRSDGWCSEHAPASPETVEEAAVEIARLVILGNRTAAYALIDKLQESREKAADGG